MVLLKGRTRLLLSAPVLLYILWLLNDIDYYLIKFSDLADIEEYLNSY